MKSVYDLLLELAPDPWRQEKGFSADLISVHDQIFVQNVSDDSIASALNDWLSTYQPCLFGKIAAKLGLITYCILSDSDLERGDAHIQEKVQKARLRWLQEGESGDKSAFVISVVSERIATALPNEAMFNLAQRICEIYLLRTIEKDRIYLDSLELQIPGKKGSRRRWDVGVNYFGSNADLRWWHDHRIPGGLALSMNSVGHLVMSGKLASAMRHFESEVSIDEEGWRHPSIDSLQKALVYAMRTIASAATTISGKATALIDLDETEIPYLPKCPVELPRDLMGKNHCEYVGFYHTDITLPSTYFRPDIERPRCIKQLSLDFSYLFDAHLRNPDHINMGLGRQVREDVADEDYLGIEQRLQKRNRSFGSDVPT